MTRLAICPDGSVVVLGEFTTAGATTLNGIGVWSAGTWSGLGAGTSSDAFSVTGGAVACDETGDIYVTGQCREPEVVLRLARYDGGSWQAVSDAEFDAVLSDIEVVAGDVYVAGAFTEIGATAIAGLARWDGQQWSKVGAGLATAFDFLPPVVSDVAVYGSGLFAVGNFTRSDTTQLDYVAW